MNKPSRYILNLQGYVAVGSILQVLLRVGDYIKVYPGIFTKADGGNKGGEIGKNMFLRRQFYVDM